MSDTDVQTYWNGEPATAEQLDVIVGPAPTSSWWCADLAGEVRAAVRVAYADEVFYLDNEDGSGWFKVTEGKGSPAYGSKSLPATSQPVAELLEQTKASADELDAQRAATKAEKAKTKDVPETEGDHSVTAKTSTSKRAATKAE